MRSVSSSLVQIFNEMEQLDGKIDGVKFFIMRN